MTKKDKQLLRALAKEGKSFKQIKEYMECSDATIRKYMKIFQPTTRGAE